MIKKTQIFKKIFLNIFIDCAVILMHAVGKGMIKFSDQYRRKNKVSKPEFISSKTMRDLGLK